MIKRYLLLTFAITYLFWGVTAILSGLSMYVHPSYNIGIILYIIAVCAPAISVYIIFQRSSDSKGIRYYLKWVFSLKHLFRGLLFATTFCAVRFGIPFIFGDVAIIGSLWQVIIYIPVMLLFGGLEEIGWRGYLQLELEHRFNFFTATAISAAIWILWHIPLCFIQGTYQHSGSYIWFSISLIGSAFSLAAVRRISNSILACILLHSISNAIVSYGISVHSGFGVIVSTGAQIVIAIGLVIFHKNISNKRKVGIS